MILALSRKKESGKFGNWNKILKISIVFRNDYFNEIYDGIGAHWNHIDSSDKFVNSTTCRTRRSTSALPGDF